MDDYTLKAKDWLNNRYKLADEYGVYLAHQPIYGFRAGHCEPGLFERYCRTYHIIDALSHLDFETLLDVGGAEGYKAFLAKELLQARVVSADVSEEACQRAAEIFDIESVVVDIHELPFGNDEFDVVLCSETLEHVSDLDLALDELIRVAKKALLITVPHESQEDVERHLADKEMHGHIHAFDPDSFNFLKSRGYEVRPRKIMSRWSAAVARRVIDKESTLVNVETGSFPKRAMSIFRNQGALLRNRMLNKRAAALITGSDGFVSILSKSYNGILFTVLKDSRCIRKKQLNKVSAFEILSMAQPLHYIAREEAADADRAEAAEKSQPKRMELASQEQKVLIAQRLDNLSLHVDRLMINSDSFEMAGWARINEKSSENSRISIILQSHNRTYVCPAKSQQRPDVTEFFNELDLDESGFCIHAATDDLERGKYRIGLFVEKGPFDKGFQFTDLALQV